MPRSEKRGIAWTQMGLLERAGLGTREKVSDQRDKLVIIASHPAAANLTTMPDADGFLRADNGSLLIRHPTNALRARVLAAVRAQPMKSDKGLEYRWPELENGQIRSLFGVIQVHAGLI